MRIRATGLVFVLLLGLQYFSVPAPNNGGTTSEFLDETSEMDDAQFPEAIPPFCSDQETPSERDANAAPIHLEINLDNHRSWVTNAFEAWLESGVGEAGAITDQFKDNYGASIAWTYRDGLRCIDRAKIRLHGDWGDHLKPGPKGFETSLDVRLQSGHIAGIVHFKLLVPETRHGDNEVFATALASEVGLLSPRTFFVEADVNGMETRYLFQEKFRNEFLEQNQIP